MKPQHWAAVLLVAFVASVAIIGVVVRRRPPPAAAAENFAEQPHDLTPLWRAPPFAYVDQHQVLTTPTSLAGRPYVANFIFTTCRTICPLLTAKMVQLQRQTLGAQLRFVSFSVDPENDTPAALAAYATHWNPDEPRWTLLATDAHTLPITAAGFHITAAKNATPGTIDPIIHSGVFVLVDGEGAVRGVYDSEHHDDFQALIRDARYLAGSPPPSAPTSARTGDELYHRLSCAGCHERNELAPTVHGLAGKRRELEASNLVVADRAYVQESILAPDLKRVRGYPLRMPTYAGLITPVELETLTDWVLALPELAAPSPDVRTEIDPICDMDVRVTADALSAEVDGHTYYFCSPVCRADFLKQRAAKKK
jgi:protein SCO1/2